MFDKKSGDKVWPKTDKGWKVPFLMPIKVIIEKSRGKVSLIEQETIENVSWPIKKSKHLFKIILNFLIHQNVPQIMYFIWDIWFFHMSSYEGRKIGHLVQIQPKSSPNPAQISISVPRKISHCGTSLWWLRCQSGLMSVSLAFSLTKVRL